MRKRREDNDHGDRDRWLLTYSDMITLLMAFFIMMYSMSVLNVSKFREAAVSIKSGFGGMVKGQGRSVLGTNGMVVSKPAPLEGDTAGVLWAIVKPLARFIESRSGKGDSKSIEIGEDRRGIVITMSSDYLLFDAGSSEIEPQAKPVLDRISRTLRKISNLVQVEGHTCDLLPRSAQYPTNWELSTARATEVLRYLEEEGEVNSWRLSAAGYSDTRPVASNSTEINRRKNRRVEIVILRPEMPIGNMPDTEPRKISDPDQAVIQRRLD